MKMKARFTMAFITSIVMIDVNILIGNYSMVMAWCIMLIGGTLNGICCYCNGWKMPVKACDIGESNRHCPWNHDVKLPILADIIGPSWVKISIGDIISVAGLLALCLISICKT